MDKKLTKSKAKAISVPNKKLSKFWTDIKSLNILATSKPSIKNLK
jgi:hypothetical protein